MFKEKCEVISLGLHDVKMRADIWKQINQLYSKIHYLEEKIKVLEAKKAMQGV